ncbi:MAG: hypothetical protein KKG99_12970 [Bacteroidetes bacterium]|nr:hypothetical protein [Bacteroidota bacterium]
MGTISKGILGGFSGKVGTVVGASIFGIDVMRSYQANVGNPRTVGQVSQRTKFSLIVQFLRLLLPIIKIGYALKAIGQSAFNACVSYNIKNSITGTYPDYSIDFSKIMISQGSLLKVPAPSIDENNASSVSIAFSQHCSSTDTEYNDLAYALFYNVTKGSVMTSMGIRKRSDSNVYVAPEMWAVGDEVHAWIFFTSPDGSKVSDSVYAGSATLNTP